MKDKHRNLAASWRNRNIDRYALDVGVVLIWCNEVYGWKNSLRDAKCERPGAIAVDATGNIFEAQGGDDYNGAKHWVAL